MKFYKQRFNNRIYHQIMNYHFTDIENILVSSKPFRGSFVISVFN